MRIPSIFMLVVLVSLEALSQDSVDVTFRYTPPSAPSAVWVAGEFNGWNNSITQMNSIGNNTFSRTVRVQMNGPATGGGVAGAYQYKFYYAGVTDWPNDPLNPKFNVQDNNNSILYVKNPTIYQFIPNQRTGLVTSSTPTISAYIFPKVGSSVDTGTISVRIDSLLFSSVGKSYNAGSQHFSLKIPVPIDNGVHNVYLSAGSTTDSVVMTVQAGAVQITNIGTFTTWNPNRTLYGVVEDSRIDTVRIVRNSTDTLIARTASGQYSLNVSLIEGLNTFKATIIDSSGSPQISSPVTYTFRVNHSPRGIISFTDLGSTFVISGSQSFDPDTGQTGSLTFKWYSDTANPQSLSGLNGAITSTIPAMPKPTIPGNYFVQLITTDPNGNADTAKSMFTISGDGKFDGSLATVPLWAKNGRIYSFFFNGLTGALSGQKINAAIPLLPYIKAMGFNMLWILPVMDNHYTIDNGSGPGYDITDFYNVAPEYGTNADFENFVAQAHALGLKVILDVTPNHTSAGHPFAVHARQYRQNSPYWSFYQHQLVTSTNYHPNLSEAITNDGFVYYGGFSSELLNYNWTDIDARQYMIDVYRWWVKQFDIDGYRFDVYWGPHDRSNGGNGGENEMGIPVREALKRLKPNIWLLGETDGTSGGTSVNYADQGGGVDAAYDWPLKGTLSGLYPNGFQNFENALYNIGYFPGPNSSYLRFLENQDESSIVNLLNYYPYGINTKPPGTAIFTAPGMPMIWEGQELGIGSRVAGTPNRAVVNWSQPDYYALRSHYQRLAQIRAQFPAFSTQKMQILSSPANIFVVARPYPGESGIVLANFNDSSVAVSLPLTRSSIDSALHDGTPYILSDIYNDSSSTMTFAGGTATLNCTVPALGSAIFVLADSVRRAILPSLPLVTSVGAHQASLTIPAEFQLYHNYPNPFNPSTNLMFALPGPGTVSLKIFNLLGQEIAELVNGIRQAGSHSVVWNGLDRQGKQANSGVYFARLQMGSLVSVQKIVLLR